MKALEFATKAMGRIPAMHAKNQDAAGFASWANDLLIRVQKEQRDLTPGEEAELNERTNIAQGFPDGSRPRHDPNDGTLPDKGVTEPPRSANQTAAQRFDDNDTRQETATEKKNREDAEAEEAARLKRT